MNEHLFTNREKNKKMIELFHLLVFLDIGKINYDEIIPHEPGDFIIKFPNKNVMVEILTAFGGAKENIEMEKIIKKILKLKNDKYEDLKPTNETMKKIVIKKVEEKQNKRYQSNIKIDEKILLIATIEYENCPTTGSWAEKLINESEFNFEGVFDKIWVLDYNASSKEVGPTITTNFEKDFFEYKKIVGNM